MRPGRRARLDEPVAAACVLSPRKTREQVAVKGIPHDADSDQPWRRLPATRHRPLGPPGSGTPAWRPGPAGYPRPARGPVSGRLTTDRDIAGRFQDHAGSAHVGPMRDRPGSPRGQVRKRSRVKTVPANTPANSSIAAPASQTAI